MGSVGCAALATVSAVLHTFVQAGPTLDALIDGDAKEETQHGLRMMWHGVSAIAWTYPVVLLLLRPRPTAVTRPVLGCVAMLNGSQAVLYLLAGLRVHGASGLFSVPEWALLAAVAVLAWLARPPASSDKPSPGAARSPRRSRWLWPTLIYAALAAILHTVFATWKGWPADLLASDTPSDPTLTLYAMWLFSCVLFCTLAAALVWSLRAPALASCFLLRYLAVLVGVLAVSWTSAVASGQDLAPSGAVSLAIQTVLVALSVPPPPDRHRTPNRKE